MEWTAYEFELTFGDTIFHFTPLVCVKVDGYIIIKYHLQVNELESIIPYYVSNGHTNELRANMLFPFMNFNQREKLDPSCPSSFADILTGNGLIKYNFIKNMNHFDNKILDKCNFTPFEITQLSPQGIKTIFKRIRNILDFIIGCFTPMILNYDEKLIQCYFPQNKPNEYNPDICNSQIKHYNDITNTYRQYLLAELRDLSNTLLAQRFLKTNIKIMSVEDMTVDSFNQSLNICHVDYNSNVSNYRKISDLLASLIKPYLSDYIEDKDASLLDGNELTTQIKIWNGTCRSGQKLPIVFTVSNESDPMIKTPIANVQSFVIANPEQNITTYLSYIRDTKLRSKLFQFISRFGESDVQSFANPRYGFNKDHAESILMDIDSNDKSKMLFLNWSNVISLTKNFKLQNLNNNEEYFEFYIGGFERYNWIIDFFKKVIAKGVSITIFYDTLAFEFKEYFPGVHFVLDTGKYDRQNHIIKILAKVLSPLSPFGKKSKRKRSKRNQSKRNQSKRNRSYRM